MAGKSKRKPGETRGRKPVENLPPMPSTGVKREEGMKMYEAHVEALQEDKRSTVHPATDAERSTYAEIQRNVMEMAAHKPTKMGRPYLYDDPEVFASEVAGYFEYCSQREGKLKCTLTGLAVWLGTDISMLRYWETNRDDLSAIVKGARQIIQEMDEQFALTGKINPTLYIFRGKNFYGYRDVVEQQITNLSGDRTPTTEEDLDKYVGNVIEAEFTEMPE